MSTNVRAVLVSAWDEKSQMVVSDLDFQFLACGRQLEKWKLLVVIKRLTLSVNVTKVLQSNINNWQDLRQSKKGNHSFAILIPSFIYIFLFPLNFQISKFKVDKLSYHCFWPNSTPTNPSAFPAIFAFFCIFPPKSFSQTQTLRFLKLSCPQSI